MKQYKANTKYDTKQKLDTKTSNRMKSKTWKKNTQQQRIVDDDDNNNEHKIGK